MTGAVPPASIQDYSESTLNNIQHSNAVWFNDGNVILLAEGVAFKMFIGLLAYASPVFADMFAFPQPPTDDAQTIDGCPVVHMHDSAENLEYFLVAANSPSFSFRIAGASFAEVAGVLTMATKYDCRFLYARAAEHFCSWFPDTLEKYYADRKSKDAVTFSDQDLVDALRLARITHLPCAIPVVLVELAHIAQCSPDIFITLGLPADDVSLVFCGMMKIAISKRVHGARFLYAISPTCQSPHACHVHGQHISYNAEAKGFQIHPFSAWSFTHSAFCKECVIHAAESNKLGREFLWGELPSIFGLRSWEDLRRDTTINDN